MIHIFTPQLVRTANPGVVPDALAGSGYMGWECDGQTIILPPVCEVPSGPFLMGADEAATARLPLFEDIPLHMVTLPRFAIGRFPLTVAEYGLFLTQTMRETPTNYRRRERAAQPDEPDAFAVLDWDDCWRYTHWLREVTGLLWRLPSEAEWEKAARGEDGRAFPWGDAPDDTGAHPTQRIGQHASGASPFGMEDAIGLAQQWTTSLRFVYPYDPTDGREAYADAPYHPRHRPLERRVIRGARWTASDLPSRLFLRNDHDPWSCLQDTWGVAGRLALDLDKAP